MYINREVAQKALKYINNDEILIFTGARQTGKTTILKYLRNYLKKRDKITFFINLEDIDYLNLLNETPKNLLNLIELHLHKIPVYVFIDEIQYLNNPSNFLKYIYDEYKGKIKLIVSGSSAFYIDRKFKDSLAGRKKIFYVYPLSFNEFLLFKGNEKLHKKYCEKVSIQSFTLENFLLPDKRELTRYFNEYVRFGGYPRVVLENQYEDKIQLIEEIANSYIKKDVLETNINYIEKYYELFRIFSSQVGGLVNKYELSNLLNISITAIENYLYIMQKSFHVILIKPFYSNIRKELRKMNKVYFYDIGLRNYFYKNFDMIEIRADKGQLYENFILIELLNRINADKIRFWRTQTKNEVDFIIDERFAFEVKYNVNTFSPGKYNLFLNKYKEIKFNVIYHTGEKMVESNNINYFKF